MRRYQVRLVKDGVATVLMSTTGEKRAKATLSLVGKVLTACKSTADLRLYTNNVVDLCYVFNGSQVPFLALVGGYQAHLDKKPQPQEA